VMNDMDTPWNDFIRTAASFARYGFAPFEKVYKKRERDRSRWDDGLYGLKRLSLVSQDTIDSWVFSEDGRSLTGLTQRVQKPSNKGQPMVGQYTEVRIPREKLILFRAAPQKDSPIGTSPLNYVYIAWRFKGEIERQGAVSIAHDPRGLKVFKSPPRYMSQSASKEEK